MARRRLHRWAGRVVVRAAVTAAFAICALLAVSPERAHAADIALRGTVTAVDLTLKVRLENAGRDPVPLGPLTVELDGRIYPAALPPFLPPRGATQVEIQLEPPRQRGRYPVITRVVYRNDSDEMELLDVGQFDFRLIRPLDVPCPELNVIVRDEQVRRIITPLVTNARVFVPAGIGAKIRPSAGGSAREAELVLTNLRPWLQSEGSIAIVYERAESGIHEAAICKGRVISKRRVHDLSPLSTPVLFVIAAASMGGAIRIARRGAETERSYLVGRWLGSVGIATALWLLYRAAWSVSEALLTRAVAAETEVSAWGRLYRRLLDGFHFDGPNYDPFFQFGAPVLLLYLLTLHYPVTVQVLKPERVRDKLWHIILAAARRGPVADAMPGLRIIAVKAFFLPLLASWTIARVFFEQPWTPLPTSFDGAIAWFIGMLIFIDVAIFTFGYLVELPQLKNEIRSAEPTVLGWLVCILCYPPFNEALMPLIDHPVSSMPPLASNPHVGAILSRVFAVVTVLLWVVYLSASIALGPKASNLTHRGIVDRGPYGYVRHPAYAAKLCVWIIAWACFGSMNASLVLTLVGLYGLRVMTEERHLSRDEEYLHYMQRVPWRFIPRIW